MLPLVSVIIPVYQAENFLESCIDSVLKQEYNNIELILVNDGSSDKSEEICVCFSNKYSNIKLFNKKNGGAASARNLGLRQISRDSQYVLFLDSDDILLPNSISSLVNIAEISNSEIVMPDRYIRKIYNTNKEKLTMLFSKNSYITNPVHFAINVMIHEGRAWRASALLYSTRLIIKSDAQFPEGHTAEDFIFNLQVMKYANKIGFLNKSTLLNIKHPNSVTATFQVGFDNTIAFIDKYVRSFLKEVEYHKKTKYNYADALLCRNIIVYLISIMSARTISKSEKKRLAAELLNNENLTKGVLQQKYSTPYFNRLSARLIMPLIYYLLRHKKRKLTIFILSIIFSY